MLEMGEVQAAGKTLGLDIATFEIRRTEDFARDANVLVNSHTRGNLLRTRNQRLSAG